MTTYKICSVQTKKKIIASHIKIKTKMKVKNLLLAGLAVAAMTACSNDINEIVDNGIQTPTSEDASMSLKFAFTQTRAVTNPGTDAGEELEWNASKVTVVLDYGDAKPVIVENLGTISSAEGNVKVAETAKFDVRSGAKVKIYAFINPGTLNYSAGVDNLVTTAKEFPSTGLDYLADAAAAANSFMMSNKGGAPEIVDIIAGSTENKAVIEVERVCAKIQEVTDKTKNIALTAQTVEGPKASIKLTQYTYANLAKSSYVLAHSTCWAAANDDPYFNQYTTEDPNYNWISGNNTTYCFENIIGGEWDINNHTSVLYEGQVYFENEEMPAATFYVKENPETGKKEIFRTWNELTQKYNGLADAENENDLKNFSIEKYTDGKCYYQAPIEDTTAGISIVRNNWYKLTVSKINDLGYPTPVPTVKEDTKLTIGVEMQPWTVQMVNIIL